MIRGIEEYAPNPHNYREDYELLNGEWEFSFADENESDPRYDKTIIVPYSYESAASGIGDTSYHGCVWYRRTQKLKKHDGAVLLHFEGVDYQSFIYVNGEQVFSHTGGFTPFCVDITDYVHEGDNTFCVKVLDSFDKAQLRGKQRTKEESYGCWYVQTTGIWKPVWLEYAGDCYLTELSVSTLNSGLVTLDLALNKPCGLTIDIEDETGKQWKLEADESKTNHRMSCRIDAPLLWSAEAPHLYYVSVTTNGSCCDRVSSYFGFCERNVCEEGMCINGQRVYMQMILYQGYWADTMLSAPNSEAIERDIDNIKALGFNGVRVHQKIENEVFYYLCDKKGLYVWGEIPSAYEFSERMRSEYRRDSHDILHQLKGHVCISNWLLFNETWGVSEINENKAQQQFVAEITDYFRENDNRPIITNDGWYHLDSDILSLHEYEQNPEVFTQQYKDKDFVVSKKMINLNQYGKAFSKGFHYSMQPVFISEFGGIAICGKNGWGYGDMAQSTSTFEKRLRGIVSAVKNIPYVSGFCYTQYNDTQQEINGLLDEYRKPKLPMERLKSVFSAIRQ